MIFPNTSAGTMNMTDSGMAASVSLHESEPNIEEFVAKITDDTLDRMHYLHAALTETLRLYPAVPAVPSIKFSKKHIELSLPCSTEFLLEYHYHVLHNHPN